MRWTKDEAEFSRILDMCESRSQLQRIEGRIQWAKFKERFNKEQLNRMAKRIGARPTD